MKTDQRLEQIKANLREVRCQLNTLDETVSCDVNTVQQLQTDVANLNESIERTLQDLLPKVERLLSAWEGRTSATPIRHTSTVLETAAIGDGETLLRLLEAGGNVQERNQHGDTALHLASAGGYVRATVYLIGFGADVNSVGQRMRSPLHSAAEGGHVETAVRLLAAGANVDSKDTDGRTPLMAAAQGHSHADFVELLLQHGASLDETDNDGNSAMVHAAKGKAWDVVKLLCDKGASTKVFAGEENSPLFMAINGGHADAVRHLLKHGGTFSVTEQIEALARAEDATVVWAFEDAVPGILRSDVVERVLRRAAMEGRRNTLVALLVAGVNVNSVHYEHVCSALMLANSNGHSNCVEESLKWGAALDPRDNEECPTSHMTSKKEDEECLCLLLEAEENTSL